MKSFSMMLITAIVLSVSNSYYCYEVEKDCIKIIRSAIIDGGYVNCRWEIYQNGKKPMIRNTTIPEIIISVDRAVYIEVILFINNTKQPILQLSKQEGVWLFKEKA